ncbi:MAG: hypothetical protein RR562_12075, partial [Longicatena sp.]
MMWFYKFEHDPKAKKVRIIWNTKATYMKNIVGFGGVIACLLNYVWIATICLGSLAILLAYYLHRHGDLVKALRISEKNNALEYTGSRYSFKHPLNVLVPVAG